MATRRGRIPVGRRRRRVGAKQIVLGGGGLLLVLVMFWSEVWPHVVGGVLLAGLAAAGWWLWRTDRRARARDRRWRQEESVKAGRRTLAEVDATTGTEFEELVAALCRGDGYTEVRRVGRFGQNPLAGLRWTAPEVADEVDPECVPNPAQVARLLAAVKALPGRGPHLYAFFGCMYYAAMRPAEVIHLQKSQCRLPATGWGLLNLRGGVVMAGKEWTDDGAVHEVHSLKRRATKATRPVPIPPVLVRMLREHIERFGVAPDGRVFRNAAGNYIDASAYGITWRRAREAPLTLEELALELAPRPYDLRHAGISFWLASGVDPAECARRAGQSIQVLFRYYAKFLA